MSKIEWTDETWNVVTGCTRISPGCDNCYMFALYPRLKAMGVPGYQHAPDVVALHPGRLWAWRSWRFIPVVCGRGAPGASRAWCSSTR